MLELTNQGGPSNCTDCWTHEDLDSGTEFFSYFSYIKSKETAEPAFTLVKNIGCYPVCKTSLNEDVGQIRVLNQDATREICVDCTGGCKNCVHHPDYCTECLDTAEGMNQATLFIQKQDQFYVSI